MKRNLYLIIAAVLLSVTFTLGTSSATAEVKTNVKVDTYKLGKQLNRNIGKLRRFKNKAQL